MKLEDKLYTSTEVADILGVSLRSVYRYLEEGKLDAEIKTATGRHRFTKNNIINFLYPDGVIDSDQESLKSKVSARNVSEKEYIDESKTEDEFNKYDKYDVDTYIADDDRSSTQFPISDDSDEVTQTDEVEEEVEVEVEEEVEANAELNQDEEVEVDWLAKFRAAAEKHRKAQESQSINKPFTDNLSTLVDEDATEVEDAEDEPEVLTDVFYYKSGVGGLRELAQYINKTARKSNLPYAFTMNAGLSLHKLIRPFSMLHIYVKENDKEFFERALELTESDQETAQLCIFIDREGVLKDRKEIHSLYVVSDLQLRKDLLDNGEIDLASELDDVTA